MAHRIIWPDLSRSSPRTGYLDQIVVAPEVQHRGVGKALIDAAKHIGRDGLDLHVNQDNAARLAFYQKCGFAIAGEDVNRSSGAPVYMMTWRPGQDFPSLTQAGSSVDPNCSRASRA